MQFSPKRKPVAVFRCEASEQIGGGHVMRCLALAGELAHRKWTCHFMTAEETLKTVPQLQRAAYNIINPQAVPEYADLLVVDNYNLFDNYERNSRKWASNIMAIEDFPTRKHDCDLLLDQTYSRSKKSYKNLVPPECHILCGSDYTLLRSQFIDLREISLSNRKDKKNVENIFISFGATNPAQIVQKTLISLTKFQGWPLNIIIVMGAGAKEVNQVKALAKEITEKSIHQINLNIDAEDVASLIMQSDLAIGAGGTMSWERACMGIPSIVISLSDNQKDIVNKLSEVGAILYIGSIDTINLANIDKAFETVRNNKGLLSKMSIIARSICDGRGVMRVADIAEKSVGIKR